MSDQRELRTQFAMQAVDMSEVFAVQFGDVRLGAGDAAYAIELTTPEGPSTGGGALAVQHIRLAPVGGVTSSRPILNAGTVTQRSFRAELRTFGHISQIYGARVAGAAPPFDAAVYDQLMQRVRGFLMAQSFEVSTEVPKTATAAPSDSAGGVAGPAARGGNPWMYVAIAAIVALGVALAVLLLRH